MTIDSPGLANGTLVRRLRLAASLVTLGLAIEAVTLLWTHPTSFIVFLLPGAPLVALGVVIYLWSLASRTTPVEHDHRPPT